MDSPITAETRDSILQRSNSEYSQIEGDIYRSMAAFGSVITTHLDDMDRSDRKAIMQVIVSIVSKLGPPPIVGDNTDEIQINVRTQVAGIINKLAQLRGFTGS